MREIASLDDRWEPIRAPLARRVVERKMMTSPNARRLVAHDTARGLRLRALRVLGVIALLAFAGAARADAVDDTLARFLGDKFPQTEAAVRELAAEAPPTAAAILEALGDNRLLIDP